MIFLEVINYLHPGLGGDPGYTSVKILAALLGYQNFGVTNTIPLRPGVVPHYSKFSGPLVDHHPGHWIGYFAVFGLAVLTGNASCSLVPFSLLPSVLPCDTLVVFSDIFGPRWSMLGTNIVRRG